MDYLLLENELKNRHSIPYNWGVKQQNKLDSLTNFIYKTPELSDVLNIINLQFSKHPKFDILRNYSLNRWYNFWSAKGIETYFSEHNGVTIHPNKFNKFIDFYINTIPFDHKTTIFPKGFKKSLPYAIEHKQELINWLYANQSLEQREHYNNRLFIVLYNSENNDEHWKLKAELSWIFKKITTYLINFDPSKLCCFSNNGNNIYADIIWAIK
ncbi:hypothetical protein [Lutibacter sp.]|uniref:hypothetical protein n=1 Tax=Lutibacter sp. TaxID=1925666 RepID=UPI0027366FE2|nr:hypothetical protein [Lutibacter sp.]MDP3314276.1 hypothetical protein [Lutibacter sp.]